MAQVTVFGGTGFLGRRIVARLAERGLQVCVAARRPQRDMVPPERRDQVVPLAADIRDASSVAAALDGATAAVNAVSLYVEKDQTTFQAIHVEGARRVAEAARDAGATCLVQLSGIGADPASASPYVRSRGAGEAAVRSAFDGSVVLRPSVMFGAGDALLNSLIPLLRRAPLLPLFGRGDTRLQPVCVEDVAAAAVELVADPARARPLYELGGPEVLSYRELLERLARRLGRRPLLLPLPFAAWRALARLAAVLPRPPVTEGQVALMERDNIADPALPGLAELDIAATDLATVLKRDFGL